MSDFFKNLRAADRQKRMRWLIILSSISGVFVVLVWVATLQQVRSGLENQQTATAAPFSKIRATASQSWSDIRFGIANTFHFFKGKIFSNEIELTPAQTDTTTSTNTLTH